MKVDFDSRSMTVEAVRPCAKVKTCTALVLLHIIECNTDIFALFLCFLDGPTALLWLITWRRGGCLYMIQSR